MRIYIYIYIYVCVCFRGFVLKTFVMLENCFLPPDRTWL